MLKIKKSEEVKQESEPDSDMTQIMELSDRELKITMINILRAPMVKGNNMKKHMGKLSKEMENLRMNKNKYYKSKVLNRNEG